MNADRISVGMVKGELKTMSSNPMFRPDGLASSALVEEMNEDEVNANDVEEEE